MEMKRFDLDTELKSAHIPERGEEYWENFPRRVTSELRTTEPQAVAPRALLHVMAWGGGIAFACLALGLTLGFSSAPRMISCAMLHNKQEIRTTLTQFSERLETLMQNEHGMEWLLADQQ
jgi:hypothetical protein